ncbi:hypothetical protein FACS189430_11190 [Bacteroidia bacterium]|nr:hypothetical protein FACS189430_11190 [Bacteroidia bacterium]
MKVKNFLFGLLLVPALAVGFNSCKDKDDDTDKDYAADIAGSYKGGISLKNEILAENVVIMVARTADNKVTLSMDQTVLESIPIKIDCTSDVSKESSVNGNTSVVLPVESLAPLAELLDNPQMAAGLAVLIAQAVDGKVTLPVNVSGSLLGGKAELSIVLASVFPLRYTGGKQ